MRYFVSWFILAFLLWAAPAAAHMPVQLLKGSADYPVGEILSMPPGLDLAAEPRLPDGLYRRPPEFMLRVRLLTGMRRGEVVEAHHVVFGNPGIDVWPEKGRRVVLMESPLDGAGRIYKVVDYDRFPAVALILTGAAVFVLVVARGKGMLAIALSLGIGAIVYFAAVPSLLRGMPLLLGVVFATLMAGLAIAVDKMGRSGWGAVVGTVAATAASAGVLWAGGHAARLTGLTASDAAVLQSLAGMQALDYRGFSMSGPLLGLSGAYLLLCVVIARSAEAGENAIVRGRELLAPASVMLLLMGMGGILPLLGISRVDTLTGMAVSGVRILNYEVIAGLLVAYAAGIVGLVVAVHVTSFAMQTNRTSCQSTERPIG